MKHKWTKETVELLLKRYQNRLELNYTPEVKARIQDMIANSQNSGENTDVCQVISSLVEKNNLENKSKI